MQTGIKGLPLNRQLDCDDMAAIEGGVITTNVARTNLTTFKLPSFGNDRNGLHLSPGSGQGDGGGGLGDGSDNGHSKD